jgi:hypothetical protein
MEYLTALGAIVAMIISIVTFVMVMKCISGGIVINVNHKHEHPPQPAMPKLMKEAAPMTQEDYDNIVAEMNKANPPISGVVERLHMFMNGGNTNG